MTLLDESSFVMPGLNLSFQVIASLEACAKQGQHAHYYQYCH